jgi:hypothetical protein
MGKLDMADLRKGVAPARGCGRGFGCVVDGRFWERALGHQSLALKIGACLFRSGGGRLLARSAGLKMRPRK